MSVITDDDSQTVVPRNQSTSMSDSSGDDLQNGTFLDKENDDSFESSFDTQKVDKLDKNLKNANIEENQPHAENIHKISSLQTYALMINFIIGTGVFGLPYAVESAGIGLSFIIVVFFYSLSVLTAVWVLENMARASGVMESYRRSRNTETPINELGFEVFNYARVGAIFFGKIGRGSAVIVISMFCYGALWAYTSVFSSSVTLIMWKYPLSSFGECGTDMSEWKLFDKCHISYLLGIVLFGCIVVPLSLIGVTEQRILQNFLTFWRFFSLTIMTLTCLIHIFYQVAQGTYEAVPESKTTTQFFFDLGGFGTLFSAFSVSLACHHNLPDVVTATRSKKHLRFIVIAGITTATFFYVVIGFSNSLCFGDDTKTPVTHNWLNYTGCNGGFGTCDTGSDRWYAIIIQWLVLLFPPINLSSEYPLFCLTLSSNIRQLIPKQIREKRPKFWLYFCRLSASLPPLIAGAIKGDLDVIFNFAGIFGFFLLFIIPSTFQIYSTFIIQRKFGKNSHISEFSGIYSSPYIAWPVLILSIACFSFSFVQFVDESFGFGWY